MKNSLGNFQKCLEINDEINNWKLNIRNKAWNNLTYSLLFLDVQLLFQFANFVVILKVPLLPKLMKRKAFSG